MSRDTKDTGAQRLQQTTGGVLLIAAGVILFLVQRGTIALRSIWLYWPVILFVTGLVKIVSPKPARDVSSGVFEIVLGGWFMACNFHWFGFTYWQTWPFIFVAIGLSQIIKALGRRGLVATEAKENGHA